MNVAINENNDLSDIERFAYLKGYVSEEAARCIEGLTLTALNLLKARFGNNKINYFETHGRITWIRESEFINELRALYDKIMVNIRALKAYEVTSEQFGPMLSPVILQKLPRDIKLEVSRRLKEQDWKIDELLDILKAEIETQETCATNRTKEFKKGNYYEHRYQRRNSRITTEQKVYMLELE